MKKIIYVFSVLILVITSCSHDGPDSFPVSQSNNGTLLRKITSGSGSNAESSEYFYVGNKIQKVVNSNGSTLDYIYEGDLIVKYNHFKNNVLVTSVNFQYNSEEKITERMVFNYELHRGYRVDFVYNTDGTIDVKGYSGDYTTQNNLIKNVKVFLFSNGDVKKTEEYTFSNGTPVTYTTEYTYDDKNSLFNAILGLNKVKYWDVGSTGNSHNYTSSYHTNSKNSSNYTFNNVYTYNSSDYPVSVNFGGNITRYYYY